MKKRLFSLVLSLSLCLGLPTAAFAATGDFDIKDGILYGYYGPGGDVTLPSGVTRIGPGAFRNCTSLTSVTLPSDVTQIGSSAFYGCTGLTSMTIPNGVTSIEAYTFYGCSSLTSVSIPSGVTSISVGAFGGCSSLTNVTIPSHITAIGMQAFADCTGLTSVSIPSGISNISVGVFGGCTGLTSVVIPASVTRIEWNAFAGCTRLNDVYFSGNAFQWKAISVDNSVAGNRYLLNANIHYNSSGLGSGTDTSQVSGGTAYASTQTVTVDGRAVEFQMYALKDENGNGTNYVRLRDLAYVLNGTAAQFSVGYDGVISLVSGQPYQSSGAEMTTPFSGDRSCTGGTQLVRVDGTATDLAAITLVDDAGGGYNYFKLRDLGAVLGFYVGWSAGHGIFIETDVSNNR